MAKRVVVPQQANQEQEKGYVCMKGRPSAPSTNLGSAMLGPEPKALIACLCIFFDSRRVDNGSQLPNSSARLVADFFPSIVR